MPYEALPERRLNQSLDAGFAEASAGPQRRFDQAALVDEWLGELWQGAGAPTSGVALAATGSLGRRELGPGSDLDLLLLVDPQVLDSGEANQLASALWFPIWNSGTVLDPAVRSPQECEDAARDRLDAAMELLDLRWVAGDAALVAEAVGRVREQWRLGARTRLPELAELVRGRASSYRELAQSSEPNLLSDRGGLRDLALVRAIATAQPAAHDRRALDHAAAVLLDARDALQVVTGSSRTRLGRPEQNAVAALTGHTTADAHHTDLAAAARAVSAQLRRSIRRAQRTPAPPTASVADTAPATGIERRPTTRLDHGVLVRSGEVVGDPWATDPLGDLAAVRHAATSGLPLAEATLARLALAPARPFRPAERALLVEALAGRHITAVYEDLDLWGIFSRWVPGWAPVRNRPQRSDVHRFTVDRHQIETVREARRLLPQVSRPDLLLVTALVHDLGKRREREGRESAHEHARRGAPLAVAAVRHLGFGPTDAALVATLVREHLTLVHLATGRNLNHPAVVQELLQAIDADPLALELLRALTEADARAAGSAAWPDWRRDLVEHLTGLARDALAGNGSAPRMLLAPQRAAQDAVLAAVRSHGIAQVLYPVPNDTEPVSEICLGAPDGEGVFAAMARVISHERLDVLSAVVVLRDGVALGTCWVSGLRPDLPPPGELRTALEQELTARRVGRSEQREGSRAPLPRTGEDSPVVTVLPGGGAGVTVVQVNAPNRPHLLLDLAQTIARHRLQVTSVQVTTLGPRAIGVLSLTDAQQRALEPGTSAQIVAGLREAAAS